MNFTREPIVETIITPKEGYKLALRSSKSSGHEEFLIDFVEVVTFGSSTFFRSQERPKAFLVPVIDYEIVEVRETKMVLKSASLDKGIKIASSKESTKSKASETTEKRKERRRTRRRKTTKEEEPKAEAAEGQPTPFPDAAEKGEDRPIIPPPSTLISETISRYKDTPTYSGAFFEQEERVEAEVEKVPQETPDSEES